MLLLARLPALDTVAARSSGRRAEAPGAARGDDGSAGATGGRARRGWRPGPRLVTWAGLLVALLLAVLLFSRFSLDDSLRRDEAIYTYGGQQLTHGIPFYVSTFDPKAPLAAMLAGLGAAIAHALGAYDVHVIRIVFFIFACLTVGALYLLGTRLSRSAVAGLVTAAVFVSFRGFALDALGGPDAKTPGIFLGVLAMLLLARRRWFWGALAGALAALVWQPLVTYVAVALLAALVCGRPGTRRRGAGAVVLGAAVPVAAMLAYYALAGALGQFVEAAIRFPIVGLRRGPETVAERLRFIAGIVDGDYGRTRLLFWGGLVLLLAGAVLRLIRGRRRLRVALTDPYLVIVLPSFALLAAFSARDFQGYPDLYPLLPYAALGCGEAVAVGRAALARGPLRWATAAAALAAVAALMAITWSWYSIASPRDRGLIAERAAVGRMTGLLRPGERLYAFGDPTPLVLSERRNPSRYIYLGSGVAMWAVRHTFGSFAGWTAHVRAADPGVITVSGWDPNGRWAVAMDRWLRGHYREGVIGRWHVFLRPDAAARAGRRHVSLTAAHA